MSDLYVWLAHPDLPDNDPVPQPADTTAVTNLLARGWVEVPSPDAANGDTPAPPTERVTEPAAPDADPDATDSEDSPERKQHRRRSGEPHTDQNKEA